MFSLEMSRPQERKKYRQCRLLKFKASVVKGDNHESEKIIHRKGKKPANHVSDTGLKPRIFKEHFNSAIKKNPVSKISK
jgi:hypothetical protein